MLPKLLWAVWVGNGVDEFVCASSAGKDEFVCASFAGKIVVAAAGLPLETDGDADGSDPSVLPRGRKFGKIASHRTSREIPSTGIAE